MGASMRGKAYERPAPDPDSILSTHECQPDGTQALNHLGIFLKKRPHKWNNIPRNLWEWFSLFAQFPWQWKREGGLKLHVVCSWHC